MHPLPLKTAKPKPKSRPRRLAPAPLTLSIALALSAAAGPIASAQAQGTAAPAAAPVLLDLPAQPLGQALNELARQAQLQMTFPAARVAGRMAPAVAGRMTVAQALERLLAGTGLAAAIDGASVVVRPVPAPAEADTTLSPVRVTAAAVQSATGPVAGYVAQRSTTGSKTDVPLREVPQSLSVVTRDAIDARGASSLAEALEYTAGFTPMTYGQDNRFDWSIARGIGTTNGANYLDGLKQAGSMYSVPRVELYGVERVEFLRGPASMLFGSGIPGGVVNAISKRPTAQARGEVRLRAGNRDRQGLAADVSGPLNGDASVMYRVVAMDERHDLQTPQARKEVRYLAPSLLFRLGRDTDLTLLAHYQQDRVDGDAYPYSYSESIGFYQPASEPGWDRFNRDHGAIGFVLDHRFSDDVSLHSRNRYSRTRLDYRLSYAAGMLSPTLLSRGAQYIRDDAKVWQSDTYLQAAWGPARWRHTTLLGLDLSGLEGSLYRGDDTSTPYDTTTGRGVGTFVEPALSPTSIGTTRQRGLYLQDQFKIDERFVLVAGLRHDLYRQHLTGAWAGDPVRHHKVTGRVGGVWLLSPEVSPYTSYATSFEPQSGVRYDGTPFTPTTGRQVEVGVRIEPTGVAARFTAALFDILQQHVLTADPSHTGFSVQRGEVGSRGVELEAFASAARGVDVTASYSYTDARVTRDTDPTLVGLRNGLVPRHKLAAWVDWRLPSSVVDGLSVGAGVRASSSVPDFANTRWVPGVTVFDARLGYRFDRWEFALNARNLLDRRYLVNCSYGTCYPADRREIVGSVTHRW